MITIRAFVCATCRGYLMAAAIDDLASVLGVVTRIGYDEGHVGTAGRNLHAAPHTIARGK